MKIGIVGIGAVGKANRDGFESIGQKLYIHDISLNTSINDVLDTEIIFLCLPTPSDKDGACNTLIVENVIKNLIELDYKGVIGIRSTVTPGFTEEIIAKYSNKKIAFVPEFLRERCAYDDFVKNHTLLAVGTNEKFVYDKVVKAHGHLPKENVLLSPTEAEILKYYNNVYAALRVTFANVMYEISNKLDCDYQKIKNSYIKTGKALDIYLDVNEDLRGFGGMCLPKDTRALSSLSQKLNLPFRLFETILSDNSKIKTTVFEGMRMEND